jgi:hypothetical protein
MPTCLVLYWSAPTRTQIKTAPLFLAGWLLAAFATQSFGQIYDTNNPVVQTFAGSGFYGYVDGQGTQTMFYNPSSIVADSFSNLFVLDASNHRIRKITPAGIVSTFAGGGVAWPPGYGTNVDLYYGTFYSMAIDHSNALWISAYGAPYLLVRIGSDGYISQTNWSGVSPIGLCVDSSNNVYIADTYANKIYRYHQTDGSIEVFAGSGNPGAVDGNGIFSSLNGPRALAADQADNIYVWDTGNYAIRRINQNRDVVTIVHGYGNSDGMGTNAMFSSVSAMCFDNSGNLLLACGSSVREISAATNAQTVAGSFSQTGYTNGPGPIARFQNVAGVCVSQGMIFACDSSDQRIRASALIL